MSSSTATPEISARSTMGEVLRAFPGAQRALFSRYHIGGCQSCGFRPDETLEEVCHRNEGLPVDEVIAHILTSHDADARILIEPSELAERISGSGSGGEDKRKSLEIIDVRTREEFEAVALPGARLFTNDLIQEIFGGWEKDIDIVVYDHTGTRSLDAAAYLIGHGFANVKCLRGGIDAYSQESDPSLPRYRLELEA